MRILMFTDRVQLQYVPVMAENWSGGDAALLLNGCKLIKFSNADICINANNLFMFRKKSGRYIFQKILHHNNDNFYYAL